MKKYYIAIPQSIKVEEDYQNGWEIDKNLIKELNLKKDDFFDVYVKNQEETKYIELTPEEFNFLENNEIWDTMNQIDSSAMIDDYEESEIRNPTSLIRIVNFLETKENEFTIEKNKIIKEIIELIQLAIKHKVGVYFFF